MKTCEEGLGEGCFVHFEFWQKLLRIVGRHLMDYETVLSIRLRRYLEDFGKILDSVELSFKSTIRGDTWLFSNSNSAMLLNTLQTKIPSHSSQKVLFSCSMEYLKTVKNGVEGVINKVKQHPFTMIMKIQGTFDKLICPLLCRIKFDQFLTPKVFNAFFNSSIAVSTSS